MRALRMVGVPYTDDDVAGASEAVKGKTEMEALIAYLQVLGQASRTWGAPVMETDRDRHGPGAGRGHGICPAGVRGRGGCGPTASASQDAFRSAAQLPLEEDDGSEIRS